MSNQTKVWRILIIKLVLVFNYLQKTDKCNWNLSFQQSLRRLLSLFFSFKNLTFLSFDTDLYFYSYSFILFFYSFLFTFLFTLSLTLLIKSLSLLIKSQGNKTKPFSPNIFRFRENHAAELFLAAVLFPVLV